MSRHEIPARNPAHKVIVGWDHPMLTYFAQVIDRAKEDSGDDDKMVLWVGTNFQELYEIDHLARAVRKYADLPAEIGAKLYGDKDDGA